MSALQSPVRFYLDTNIFIYAVEAHPEYVETLTRLFEDIEDGVTQAVTSELSLAEALVKPLADGNAKAVRAFERALQSAGCFKVHPVSREVLREAARMRAATSLKLPDAIHAATAHLTHCTVFLTNDDRLKRIKSLQVETLSDFSAALETK